MCFPEWSCKLGPSEQIDIWNLTRVASRLSQCVNSFHQTVIMRIISGERESWNIRNYLYMNVYKQRKKPRLIKRMPVQTRQRPEALFLSLGKWKGAWCFSPLSHSPTLLPCSLILEMTIKPFTMKTMNYINNSGLYKQQYILLKSAVILRYPGVWRAFRSEFWSQP